MKIKIKQSSDRRALRREIKARETEIEAVLADPRNGGYEITSPHGTALLVPEAAAVLGRRGGQATSEAKADAARENAKKGGRLPEILSNDEAQWLNEHALVGGYVRAGDQWITSEAWPTTELQRLARRVLRHLRRREMAAAHEAGRVLKQEVEW